MVEFGALWNGFVFEYVGKQFNTSLTSLAHDNMTPAANSCGVAEPKQEYRENGSMEKGSKCRRQNT